MAEDTTVESPTDVGGGEQTLRGLQDTLAKKQEELAGLRAERVRAQQEAVERVQRERVLREIEQVDAAIAAEREQLEIQQGLDAKLVGTGIPSEGSEPFEEPVDPEKIANPDGDPHLETLEYGAVAQVGPPPVEDHSDGSGDNDETSEGDEN